VVLPTPGGPHRISKPSDRLDLPGSGLPGRDGLLPDVVSRPLRRSRVRQRPLAVGRSRLQARYRKDSSLPPGSYSRTPAATAAFSDSTAMVGIETSIAPAPWRTHPCAHSRSPARRTRKSTSGGAFPPRANGCIHRALPRLQFAVGFWFVPCTKAPGTETQRQHERFRIERAHRPLVNRIPWRRTPQAARSDRCGSCWITDAPPRRRLPPSLACWLMRE